jgi:hypothetical protein
MVAWLKTVRPEDLTENSVLLGTAAQMIETLEKVESFGFEEVIPYINVGLEPHRQVKEEMACFMEEVARHSRHLQLPTSDREANQANSYGLVKSTPSFRSFS